MSFRLLRILIALACLAPLLCQSETGSFFSIMTQQTFGPADVPSVHLSGYGVKAIQIRVYRVKDAVEFYRRMEATHSFGQRPPEVYTKRSWIETIHNWKRSLRREIRSFLRGQFSESVSAHFRGEAKPKEQPASPETYYAEAPLLNKNQLVLSLFTPLESKTRWATTKVPLHVKEDGIYLVEAVSQGQRAYTVLIKSDLVLVTKLGHKHLFAFVANRDTGEPVPGAE